MSAYELKMRQALRRRKKRQKLLCNICTIIIIVLIALLLCGTAKSEEVAHYEYHTCDALWDFVKYCPQSMNKWDFIDKICELNGIEDVTVHPGRLYMVPIYK